MCAPQKVVSSVVHINIDIATTQPQTISVVSILILHLTQPFEEHTLKNVEAVEHVAQGHFKYGF